MCVRALKWGFKVMSYADIPPEHRLALIALCWLASGKRGCNPTIGVIAAHSGLSEQEARDAIDALCDCGLITRYPGGFQLYGRIKARPDTETGEGFMLGTERDIPTETRALVFARDGRICRYCSTQIGPFHLDHVHPWVRGGTHDPENLAVCCATCNVSKGAKTLEEWKGGHHA